MKKKYIDDLHDHVSLLCATMREDTVSLLHLNDLLYGVIELARTDRTIEAIGIAREVASYLAEGHSRSIHDARKNDWVTLENDGGARVHFTAPFKGFSYTNIRCEPPRPTATVEQMRAAADKAMMTEDNTYLCAGCGQKTLTDGEKPLGWHFNANVRGGVYRALCGVCFVQGPVDEWECDACGKTSLPMRSMPTGWMEQSARRGDDDVGMETVCDECAMGAAAEES